ncbi:hypothetical protein CRUP_011794 [Coryphaenoides rupestris]|nr:hypothetical protein CRUP_011794 [Coryphaenoides rupestris]
MQHLRDRFQTAAQTAAETPGRRQPRISTSTVRVCCLVSLQAVYMFYALALVCDDYFVPSLEKLCERLNLSEDVAGATFMAAGSSAPELFTSVIGVFITKGDVGVGTIVGSAVFNILCIIGVCGIFAGQFIYDEKVVWWEALTLILMYFVYILIMKMNSHIVRFLERRNKSSDLRNGAASNTELDDTCDATVSVLMVDELLSAYPHQLSFSEAGMRIMITSHFSPRTRLTMASRMLITEVASVYQRADLHQRGDRRGRGESHGEGVAQENGVGGANATDRGPGRRRDDQEAGNETENEDNENNENDEEEEEEAVREGPFVTVIGFTLGIPDVIMGITFLAAGTSVPDCMASLIIKLNSKGLIISVGLLLASVFITVMGVHLNHWKLDRRLGLISIMLYSVFVCFSCLIEYNIFTFVNLPTYSWV